MELTYIDDGMAVDEPHHAWPWMARDTGLEASPFAFFERNAFRFAHEYWRLLRLGILVRFLWNTGMAPP